MEPLGEMGGLFEPDTVGNLFDLHGGRLASISTRSGGTAPQSSGRNPALERTGECWRDAGS